MLADEMFEELGYYRDNGDDTLTYSRPIKDPVTFGYIDSKMITFENWEVSFTNVDFLTPEELQAINKKVEELGWIENN